MNNDELRHYLEFYRDLGRKEIFRSRGRPMPVTADRTKSLPVLFLPPVLPSLAPENDTLDRIFRTSAIAAAAGSSEARKKIVFGSGNAGGEAGFRRRRPRSR